MRAAATRSSKVKRGRQPNSVYSRIGARLVSRIAPVGSPDASRSISVPCGAFVSRSMPASASAAELATEGKGGTPHQPQMLRISTG